ncbi:probable serine/threonine-protein kinase DDB_G0282963 [Helianthus annuus]|uniref:probable serine/threonine-protein kinase DDB_G0282963 n=1 Tax=Helianthus annuus TaxID=4232 RepID=UPI000B8F8184|nr:probable serine/threonine-protein kinase DDB_G0282963 [Helianthus annuus]
MSLEWGVRTPKDVHEEDETSSLEKEKCTDSGINKKINKGASVSSSMAADCGSNMGTTSLPNNNNYSRNNNFEDNNNNSGDPCDPPPPPVLPTKPNIEPNSGTKNKEDIDLNNSPNSLLQSVNNSRSNLQASPQQKLGKKKKKYNFPSMKMKDTLWLGRNSESSKNRSRGTTSCEEVGSADMENTNCQAIAEEADLTIKVGEKLGFRVSGCEEKIKKQIRGAQVTNPPK